MGRTYDAIDDRMTEWLGRQRMFTVATAPQTGGRVNVSPKGIDGTFAVLGPTSVGYLDLVGSGAETMAHLRDNGRITLLFSSFEGPPRIVRLYGKGRVVEPDDAEFTALMDHFTAHRAVRSVIVIEVDRIADSCGYGVPEYRYEGQRSRLVEWGESKSDAELRSYQLEKNTMSVDGLPALRGTGLRASEGEDVAR